MDAQVLVLDAGTAAANNLMRSLRAGAPGLGIVGCNSSRFFLKKSPAQRNYVLPLSPRTFGTALRRIAREARIDLVIPTNDLDVARLSELRRELGRRVFLPGKRAIERCQDKYALSVRLRRLGIAAPLTCAIRRASDIDAAFRSLAPRGKLWCRVRRGAASHGAIPVKTRDQVQAWIDYWERMRGVPPGSFTLSEYLPGRDFCVQCLWDDGRLVLAKMAERITYLDNGGPSGVSSMPALAKTVFEPRAIETCRKAIRAVDARASGVFFVDLKENDAGEACVTEINAGRFATMTNIHDLTGQHNMATTYVRLALGDHPRIAKSADFAEGYYLVRSVDTLPAIVRQDQLFRDLAGRFA